MTKLKLIFTLALLTLAVTIVSAQQPPPPPENDFVTDDKPQNRNEMIAQELGLTDQQKAQWRQINRQGRLKTREAQQKFQRARADLDQYIYSDAVDEPTLQAKLRSVVEAQSELIRIRTMSELAVRNILTPEQLVKFRTFRQRIKEERDLRQLQQRRQRRRRLNQNRRNPNLRNRLPQNRQRPI